MQRQDMAYRRHTHSKKQPAPKFAARPKTPLPTEEGAACKSPMPRKMQAALHKAHNSFIMPTRFHHRTAL